MVSLSTALPFVENDDREIGLEREVGSARPPRGHVLPQPVIYLNVRFRRVTRIAALTSQSIAFCFTRKVAETSSRIQMAVICLRFRQRNRILGAGGVVCECVK